MNLELSEEQLALRDAVRRFLADEASVSDHVRPLLDDPTGTTEPVWRGLAQIGTTGLLVPEEHGGAAMTMVEAGIVLEELGRALHPGPWLSTAVAAPRALAQVAEAEESAKLLQGIADGDVRAAVVLPPAGMAPAEVAPAEVAPAGMAMTVTDGDDVVLRGEAHDVADAAAANQILAMVPDEDGGTAVVSVDASAPGIEVTPVPAIDATHKRARVALLDCPGRRLGVIGPEQLSALVDDVLVARGAEALGAAEAVLELAVDYAKVRVQFGQPIGAFQAVQHLCVDMYETVELARGGVLYALWAADASGPHERHAAAVRVKAFAGRLATVADTAIQVLGGIGYTWEHDAQLYLRRLLDWSAFRGSADRYLIEVGQSLGRQMLQGR